MVDKVTIKEIEQKIGKLKSFYEVQEEKKFMLTWAVIFLIIAVIAGLFGFRGVSSTATTIAKVLFFIFIVLFLIYLITGYVNRY